MLTLPYNHPQHSSLGAALEDELPETLYGIPRDLEPYNQTVIGTNTLTIQTLETSRTLRSQITQLAAAADIFEETYRLLNRLQATTQQLAEARPSPEYARAVWRNRRWVQRYQQILNQQPALGPEMWCMSAQSTRILCQGAPVHSCHAKWTAFQEHK